MFVHIIHTHRLILSVNFCIHRKIKQYLNDAFLCEAEGGGGLWSIKSAHKLVAKLLIYHEIELLLLVYSVLIKTFDLKLDFCPNIFFLY